MIILGNKLFAEIIRIYSVRKAHTHNILFVMISYEAQPIIIKSRERIKLPKDSDTKYVTIYRHEGVI